MTYSKYQTGYKYILLTIAYLVLLPSVIVMITLLSKLILSITQQVNLLTLIHLISNSKYQNGYKSICLIMLTH